MGPKQKRISIVIIWKSSKIFDSALLRSTSVRRGTPTSAARNYCSKFTAGPSLETCLQLNGSSLAQESGTPSWRQPVLITDWLGGAKCCASLKVCSTQLCLLTVLRPCGIRLEPPSNRGRTSLLGFNCYIILFCLSSSWIGNLNSSLLLENSP